MRNGALATLLTSLLLCLGALALGACGGDESNRREVSWRPSDNLPLYASHWWWDPVEDPCEEDSDCDSGERCQRVRLGTCGNCPPGESHHICVPEDWDGPDYNATAGN